MDRFIAAMPGRRDDDLMVCDGVAYQIDQGNLVVYDEPYYNKCLGYEGQQIAQRLNAGRIGFVAKHFGPGLLVDIGIGSGEFIKMRPRTHGRDVNPVAIEWLKRNELWAEHLTDYGAHTYWDVIEHVPTPEQYLSKIGLHCFAFFSIPVFDDLSRVRDSKHYRPGEHLYYWTHDGFIAWMDSHGFLLLESDDFETRAGRESIRSYAFKRNRHA